MSGEVTGWVLRHGPKDRAERAVLVVIADAANRDGLHSHPGLAALIEGSGYTRSTVLAAVARLLESGRIEVEEQGGGRGRATVYRVIKGPIPGRFSGVNGPIEDEKGSDPADETVRNTESSPLIQRSTNGKDQRAKVLESFDHFWKIYPRREAKGEARKAWGSALRRASVEAILEGARRYRDDPNRDPAYTAHPATWLNQDRWEDDPLPPRSGPASPNGKSEPQSWSMAYTQ